MEITTRRPSPLGDILLSADGQGITGLWFVGQKRFARSLGPCREGDSSVLQAAARWLDVYFSGRDPGPVPPLHPAGTPFQREVWALLNAVPYGRTTTYGAMAKALCRGGAAPSPRAVGGAVGRNPISILAPCHRVLGADGSLTGYAGGLEKKLALLRLEGISL